MTSIFDSDSFAFGDFTDQNRDDIDYAVMTDTQFLWYPGIQSEYSAPFEAEIATVYADATVVGDPPVRGDKMADWYMVKGDTYPRIRASLTQNGAPVNLSGATVAFKMRLNGRTMVNDAADVVSASGGVVEYEWEPGDTDSVGMHEAFWVVTYSDETVQTFPGKGFNIVQIQQSVL